MRLTTCYSILLLLLFSTCTTEVTNENEMKQKSINATDILGNSDYRAISYGGYRLTSRDQQPTLAQLEEDMRLLSAMGIRVLRTYNVQLPHASNVLKAIRNIQATEPDFEMYVMLGAWIDCKNAWTGQEPDHDVESDQNAAEIDRAVALAQAYPDIVKVLAVGNEAMVKWAASYYVQPDVILKWVKHLQDLKKQGQLPAKLWITSSDNFASWGGGEDVYHVPALMELIHAVDYISVHTYPMHDTHYNPEFWRDTLTNASDLERVEAAMLRSRDYAVNQVASVRAYMQSVGADKPIHIGETGWASASNALYGPQGSHATDEYKQARYHELMREWTDENAVSCFFFEAFDEPWKDAGNPGGSENYFGLFTVDGKAKYAIWELVDQGVFNGLGRNGQPVTKTYDGEKSTLLQTVLPPITSKVNAH